jgi:hypothetical protein
MKLNKAEKFVTKMYKEGKTRNGVRSAIFEKLNTWNFPPEYVNALATCDPNYGKEAPIQLDYLDDYICGQCDNCHETCFCGEEADPIEEALDGIGHSAEAEEAVFGSKATNHDAVITCLGAESTLCGTCPQKTFCTILEVETECAFCRELPCVCAIIELPKLPEPGTQKFENMVDFMREDMANDMGYSRVIEHARKSIEGRGLNFDKEFEKWKENKGTILCNDCGTKTKRTIDSTGYCEECGSADVKSY